MGGGPCLPEEDPSPSPLHPHAPTAAHQVPSRMKGELVRIFLEANPDFFLTAKGASVALCKAKQQDDVTQQWYLDETSRDKVIDAEGHSAFTLINKASQLVLKHLGAGKDVTVQLGSHKENSTDSSILWTWSKDMGDGYRAMRPADNPKLNLDADHADKENGGVKENNNLILFKWKNQDNQKWKIKRILV